MTFIPFPKLAPRCEQSAARLMTMMDERGFSLVEVLVSMLVLAVGVIGAVGMQLAALRTTQQSVHQTSALHIASDIASSIHAWNARKSQSDDVVFPEVDYNSLVEPTSATPAVSCFDKHCDAQALAEFKIYEWKKQVGAALPSGRIRVCYDITPWDAASKKLKWECSGDSGGAAPLVVKIGWQIKNPDGSLIRNADGGTPPNVAIPVVPA